MWRRFVDKARSFIRNSPSPPPVASSVASSIPRAIGQPGRYDPSKVDAYNELRNAVKELSVGVAKPITSPAPSTLDEWSKMKPEDLTAEQLEELAKVNFEGSYGQSKDLKKAVEYWTIASSKGSVESKYSLAVCRKDGVGIERDQALALKELEELATKNNHTMAHYAVAIMYDKGLGCDVDVKKAFQHYQSAARGGILPALHNIGNAYAYGSGVEKNENYAFLYYQAAADGGDPASSFIVGTWYYHGKAGLTRDAQKSFKYQLQAAQAKHPGAMFNVGVSLLTGDGVPADPPKAAEWLVLAGAANMPTAYLNLSKMYMDGYGVAQDLKKAKEYALKAAEHFEIGKELLQEIAAREAQKA